MHRQALKHGSASGGRSEAVTQRALQSHAPPCSVARAALPPPRAAMSDALVDSVAGLMITDAATFASLPQSLALRIFLALPVDARGRACCVCRAWRDALADPLLWSRLDLSGVQPQRLAAVLHGASAARAVGQLSQLDLSQQEVRWGVLRPVLTANAGSLRELHLYRARAARFVIRENTVTPIVEEVMAAAPLLQVLTAEDVSCMWQDAPQMLRAEPPFAPLQMRGNLLVRSHDSLDSESFGEMEHVGPFAAALADAAVQPALLHLRVQMADTAQPAVMNALVDAAVARRLRGLTLVYCTPPAPAPLARLLAGGSLAALEIGPTPGGPATPLFDVAGAALVADTLRKNTTLTKLVLYNARLFVDVDVAGTLLSALVGHPSLRELRITYEPLMMDRSAFGAALAALIAADAPALQTFDCRCCSLEDAGLAPIVEALALNHHLRELDVSRNVMSEEFAREQLLPAVRANTTLCELKCRNFLPGPPAAVEAEELVRHRRQHD